MREGVASDDGLVGLDGLARDTTEKLAGLEEGRGPDRRVEGQSVLPDTKGQHDLLERRVARAFTDAVDRALDLTNSTLNGGQTVGDREAEIVVTVRAENGAIRVGDLGD